MTTHEEVKEQVASEDYECDFIDCDIPIPEETVYVRVTETVQKGTRDGKPSARQVWKFHRQCWVDSNA